MVHPIPEWCQVSVIGKLIHVYESVQLSQDMPAVANSRSECSSRQSSNLSCPPLPWMLSHLIRNLMHQLRLIGFRLNLSHMICNQHPNWAACPSRNLHANGSAVHADVAFWVCGMTGCPDQPLLVMHHCDWPPFVSTAISVGASCIIPRLHGNLQSSASLDRIETDSVGGSCAG